MKGKLVFVSAVGAAAALLASALPAPAITNGELDGNGHPYVGMMIAQDAAGNPLWQCTGTLMSSTVFLTAGHCVEAPAAHVEIWFAADVESGIPANGYPFDGDVGGTPYTHPDYDPNAFFRYDLGVVVLDVAYPMSRYGDVPALNSLNNLKRGKKTTFDSVGYGLQRLRPTGYVWERVRMVSRPHLVQINVPGQIGDFAMITSNNASSGGTCEGDSGGPNFLAGTNVIAGVTSFGKNQNCVGTGGVYRLDGADDLTWLATFGITP